MKVLRAEMDFPSMCTRGAGVSVLSGQFFFVFQGPMMSSRRGLRVDEHGAHRIGVEEHGGGKLPGAGTLTFDLLQMELVVVRKEWTNR